MHLVVDACGVRTGSAATVIGGLLHGWADVAPGDRITVLVDGPVPFALPPGVAVHRLGGDATSLPRRLWAQSVGVRRACRRLRADALLSALTASSFAGARCRSATIVHDLRHEVCPEQFSVSRRVVRRVSYGWTFRRADVLLCNSERTRGDVLARRPRLAAKTVTVHLGADHARGWRADAGQRGGAPYVLAFGHFANKNVAAVLAGWQAYCRDHSGLCLHVCGLDGAGRAEAQRLVAELGLGSRVELLPWLPDERFQGEFAGAAVVLFPSGFEGFGLPAVEAMLLGRPLVVSADPALLEVTAGHAVVAADTAADTAADILAAAIDAATARTEQQLADAARHAAGFTWARAAARTRAVLLGDSAGAGGLVDGLADEHVEDDPERGAVLDGTVHEPRGAGREPA